MKTLKQYLTINESSINLKDDNAKKFADLKKGDYVWGITLEYKKNSTPELVLGTVISLNIGEDVNEYYGGSKLEINIDESVPDSNDVRLQNEIKTVLIDIASKIEQSKLNLNKGIEEIKSVLNDINTNKDEIKKQIGESNTNFSQIFEMSKINDNK